MKKPRGRRRDRHSNAAPAPHHEEDDDAKFSQMRKDFRRDRVAIDGEVIAAAPGDEATEAAVAAALATRLLDTAKGVQGPLSVLTAAGALEHAAAILVACARTCSGGDARAVRAGGTSIWGSTDDPGVAATPAAATWTFRRDETMRHRGRDVAITWRRDDARPRPRRGYSVEVPRTPQVRLRAFVVLAGAREEFDRALPAGPDPGGSTLPSRCIWFVRAA